MNHTPLRKYPKSFQSLDWLHLRVLENTFPTQNNFGFLVLAWCCLIYKVLSLGTLSASSDSSWTFLAHCPHLRCLIILPQLHTVCQELFSTFFLALLPASFCAMIWKAFWFSVVRCPQAALLVYPLSPRLSTTFLSFFYFFLFGRQNAPWLYAHNTLLCSYYWIPVNLVKEGRVLGREGTKTIAVNRKARHSHVDIQKLQVF